MPTDGDALEMPNFAALLGPSISAVPEVAVPTFLAGLERIAAGRYRGWAERSARFEAELLACSQREDEIAERVEALFPIGVDDANKRDAELPGAERLYVSVFEGLSMLDQIRIQANAERQGALAWRGMAAQTTDGSVADALEALAKLELESADLLDALLADSANHPDLGG